MKKLGNWNAEAVELRRGLRVATGESELQKWTGTIGEGRNRGVWREWKAERGCLEG